MSRVFLIPGLGADSRIYKNIKLDGHELIAVEWLLPNLNDTLSDYAQRIINKYNIIYSSVVIGNSLGGMIAVEIANKVKLSKVIIISSIKSAAEAPGYFSVFKNLPVHRAIPGRLFTSMGFMIKLMFGKTSTEDAALFVDMLKNTSPVFVKWAMGAILKWNNTRIPDNIYHIIGNKDLLFPYRRIKNATIVPGGSHIMIFDKADEINKLLKDILAQ